MNNSFLSSNRAWTGCNPAPNLPELRKALIPNDYHESRVRKDQRCHAATPMRNPASDPFTFNVNYINEAKIVFLGGEPPHECWLTSHTRSIQCLIRDETFSVSTIVRLPEAFGYYSHPLSYRWRQCIVYVTILIVFAIGALSDLLSQSSLLIADQRMQ